MTTQGWSLCTKKWPQNDKKQPETVKRLFFKISIFHLSSPLKPIPSSSHLAFNYMVLRKLGKQNSRRFSGFPGVFSQNSRLFFRDNHKFALVFLTTYHKRNEKFCLNNFSRPGEKNSRRISQVFQKAKCNPRRIPGVPGFPGVLRTMN